MPLALLLLHRLCQHPDTLCSAASAHRPAACRSSAAGRLLVLPPPRHLKRRQLRTWALLPGLLLLRRAPLLLVVVAPCRGQLLGRRLGVHTPSLHTCGRDTDMYAHMTHET